VGQRVAPRGRGGGSAFHHGSSAKALRRMALRITMRGGAWHDSRMRERTVATPSHPVPRYPRSVVAETAADAGHS